VAVKTKNATLMQLVTRCAEQTVHQLIHIAGHPQRIRRRLAASHLLADAFLQIDDRTRLIHCESIHKELWVASSCGSDFQCLSISARRLAECVGGLIISGFLFHELPYEIIKKGGGTESVAGVIEPRIPESFLHGH